jgi:hypothetical protein
MAASLDGLAQRFVCEFAERLDAAGGERPGRALRAG